MVEPHHLLSVGEACRPDGAVPICIDTYRTTHMPSRRDYPHVDAMVLPTCRPDGTTECKPLVVPFLLAAVKTTEASVGRTVLTLLRFDQDLIREKPTG